MQLWFWPPAISSWFICWIVICLMIPGALTRSIKTSPHRLPQNCLAQSPRRKTPTHTPRPTTPAQSSPRKLLPFPWFRTTFCLIVGSFCELLGGPVWRLSTDPLNARPDGFSEGGGASSTKPRARKRRRLSVCARNRFTPTPRHLRRIHTVSFTPQTRRPSIPNRSPLLRTPPTQTRTRNGYSLGQDSFQTTDPDQEEGVDLKVPELKRESFPFSNWKGAR